MIKLVATDMDGTLLTSTKEIPQRIFPMIDELAHKGAVFAAISGRDYFSLARIWQDVLDKMVIVSDNGGRLTYQGETLFANYLAPDSVVEILETLKPHKELCITLCGIEGEYMFERNIFDVMDYDLAFQYFPNSKVIKSLADLPATERIIKFAVLDPTHNSLENIYEHVKHLDGKYQVAVTGTEWTDIMNVGINKGHGIKHLQDKFGITKEETMVFGDQMNDYEMMFEAHFSFAMDNGVDQVKAAANYLAPSNDDAGVIQVLEDLLAQRLEGKYEKKA